MDAIATQPEPLTIESVQAQLDAERLAHQETKDALATALENHADAGDALSASIAAKAKAEADLAKAQTALTEASGIIDGQKQTIGQLETRIADLQTSPSEFPTIVVDKVTYEVQAKIIKFKGADITVAQLLKDKALQKELVKVGAGFLVKKEA